MHLPDEIALGDLAAVAGYSVYHFCRAFKQSKGEAPFAFVTRVRAEDAARLLQTTA